MIQPLFNGMLTILLAKFMLNDLPHAAGLPIGHSKGNPNRTNELPQDDQLQELEDKMLISVREKYSIDIPEGVFVLIQHLEGASSAYNVASFLLRRGEIPTAHDFMVIGRSHIDRLAGMGVVSPAAKDYVDLAYSKIIGDIERQDFTSASDKAMNVGAALHVLYTYEVTGRMKGRL